MPEDEISTVLSSVAAVIKSYFQRSVQSAYHTSHMISLVDMLLFIQYLSSLLACTT